MKNALSLLRTLQLKSCFVVLVVLGCLGLFYVTDLDLSSWWDQVDPWIYTTSQNTPTATKMNNSSKIYSTKTVPLTTKIPDHIAYTRNYHFIMDEPDKCRDQKPFLVLMVPVAPQNLEARDAIRRTWGNESLVQGKAVTVLFLLGLPGGADAEKQQERVRLESEEHRDLLQSNFMDTYRNLTTKTMVIMDWLVTHCPQASYAMKIDSDMFLNLENLMRQLLAPDTPKQNYITGMLMWNRPVVRNKASKWYVSKETYPEEIYPTYALGMGYLFSNDLPEKLVTVSKDIKPFNIEDAYVGACLKRLGIALTNPPNPGQWRAYESGEYRRCDYVNAITTILNSVKKQVDYWQDMKKPGPPC